MAEQKLMDAVKIEVRDTLTALKHSTDAQSHSWRWSHTERTIMRRSGGAGSEIF